MNNIEALTRILKDSRNVVFFGGAGMSTESGLPDFRSANGIYSKRLHQKFRPEEMASHNFFVNHTEAFFEFYREHRIFRNIQPNAGHKALAELERRGLVNAQRTAGRFVTEDTAALSEMRKSLSETIVADFYRKMRGLGLSDEEIISVVRTWIRENTADNSAASLSSQGGDLK